MDMGMKAYQDQRGIVVAIAGIDIDASLKHLLADFEVTAPAALAEEAKILAGVERAIFLQLARRNGAVFIGQSHLDLVLLLGVHGDGVERDGDEGKKWRIATNLI